VAAFGYIVSTTMAKAELADLQAKCSADAEATFQELRQEYASEAARLQLSIRAEASDYRNYYNAKLARCILLINNRIKIADEHSQSSTLLDTDRRLYATYMEMNGKVQTCTLIPNAQQVTTCKSRKEFDSFVSQYMNK
jgi:hypothetical protein